MEFVDHQTLSFLGIATVLTLSPGADTLLVVRNTLRSGRRHGLATAFGICSGLFVHAVLSALGLSVVLLKSSAAFTVVKIVGAGYLACLGIGSLVRAFRGRSGAEDEIGSGSGRPDSPPFMEGLLTNVLNPKVAIFYLALLPQFLRADDPVLLKSLFLASLHWTVSILWLIFLVLSLERVRSLVSGDRFRRGVDALGGTILLGLGVRLALERR